MLNIVDTLAFEHTYLYKDRTTLQYTPSSAFNLVLSYLQSRQCFEPHRQAQIGGCCSMKFVSQVIFCWPGVFPFLWRGHDCRTWAVVCASSPYHTSTHVHGHINKTISILVLQETIQSHWTEHQSVFTSLNWNIHMAKQYQNSKLLYPLPYIHCHSVYSTIYNINAELLHCKLLLRQPLLYTLCKEYDTLSDHQYDATK